jgi:hypothetical protein
MTIIGGEYDTAKRKLYEDDLKRLRSAAAALVHLIKAVGTVDLT